LNFSLRNFQEFVLFVIYCLIINVLCSLATAMLEYHSKKALSTTFRKKFIFYFCFFCGAFKEYHNSFLFVNTIFPIFTAFISPFFSASKYSIFLFSHPQYLCIQ